MFNPVTQASFDAVVEAWAGAVLRLVLLMPRHPAVRRSLPDLCALTPTLLDMSQEGAERTARCQG